MSEYISRDKAIDAIVQYLGRMKRDFKNWQCTARIILDYVPPEDVQPVTFCKNCQWLADIKDVDTDELYHTCGVLAFDVPDGFACNQGKRKGADNV